MYIILGWKHKYKKTFAIACSYMYIVKKLCATDLSVSPDKYSRQYLHNLLLFVSGSF